MLRGVRHGIETTGPRRAIEVCMKKTEFDAPVPYVKPAVETLSDREILEEIGPAQAYSGSFPFNF